MRITSKIAELVGMHIGDGTLYKTSRGLVWELRGDLKEKDYYLDNVVPLLYSLFNQIFIPKFRSGGKNGCFGVQISKKQVTNFFIKLKFKPGKKTYTVRIPYYIKMASRKIKFAFLRGYFDTDGCLAFRKGRNPPRIEFATASKYLREDLFILLNNLKYRPFKWGNKGNSYRIGMYGNNNLEKFMREIRPRNTKHLNKYLLWKFYGFNPNAEVA